MSHQVLSVLSTPTGVYDVELCEGTRKRAALQVAIALSLLTAAVARPPFNQLICTFSATPQLHLVKGNTLVKQVDVSRAQQTTAC